MNISDRNRSWTTAKEWTLMLNTTFLRLVSKQLKLNLQCDPSIKPEEVRVTKYFRYCRLSDISYFCLLHHMILDISFKFRISTRQIHGLLLILSVGMARSVCCCFLHWLLYLRIDWIYCHKIDIGLQTVNPNEYSDTLTIAADIFTWWLWVRSLNIYWRDRCD